MSSNKPAELYALEQLIGSRAASILWKKIDGNLGSLRTVPGFFEDGLTDRDARKIGYLTYLAKSINQSVMKKGAMCSGSNDVFLHFHERLRDEKKEYFFILLLDTKHQLIREVNVSIGSLNSSIVHPREVFKEAIKDSAESVILVHNHPSGSVTPSPEDLCITSRLVEVGKLLGIDVLDHIIIGDGCYLSMKEQKLAGL